jgi:hypothetical protein
MLRTRNNRMCTILDALMQLVHPRIPCPFCLGSLPVWLCLQRCIVPQDEGHELFLGVASMITAIPTIFIPFVACETVTDNSAKLEHPLCPEHSINTTIDVCEFLPKSSH